MGEAGYFRRFNGKKYWYDSLDYSKQEANKRARKIRRQGGLARITVGSMAITHSPYYRVWKRDK